MSIKQRFVQTILADEGKRLVKNQGVALQQKLQFHTNKLYNTRNVSVSSGAEMDGSLTFSHTAYERFLDLNRLRYGSKVVSRKRKIHNRFVFGHYTSIAGRLMYDLTNEVIETIKSQIKTDNNG